MQRNDAVTAVTGEIFREGWSKVRGSMQGLGAKRSQMVRAAKGHRAAVFKAIKSGGCHTKAQLSNQLEYLTTKSSHIVDSRGVFDGKTQLDTPEIKSVTDRFSARWDEGFRPKMGHTTHMLMSFPVGTKGEDVRDIAAGVCERFFANDARNFDYLIAVHEDRAHPHAHVVLNRRSQEGEYFYLGRDHHFNYDDFRIAMVEEAEKVGVRLEATRRIVRGDVTYAPRIKDIYAAKSEGRSPITRERVGSDLDQALVDIASTARTFRSLAAEASAENRHDISNALFRAAELLAHGGHLEQNGEVYMDKQDSFDDLKGRFAERAERVEHFVRHAPDTLKAKYEKQLDAIYRNVAHMQPVGVRSFTLNDAASATGVYSEMNIDKAAVAAMSDPETRAQIETALRGTGISVSSVTSRVEQGASNAWLEQRWLADDLTKIAESEGLNLERNADLKVAVDRLDEAHVHLGQVLERAGVLREDGVAETDVDSEEDYFRDVQQPEQEEFMAKHPELLASPSQVYREDDDGRAIKIIDPQRADQIDREVQAIMGRSDGRLKMEEAIAADFKARYPDMPDHLADGLAATYAASHELNAHDENHRHATDLDRQDNLNADSAELRRVIAHERNDKINAPFAENGGSVAFRREIERALDDDQVEALRSGDSDALSEVIDDRLDRLYAAKAYLQSDETTANSEATREVVSEIAEEEYDAQRLKHTHGTTEKGQTHG
ncbi:MAG: relaxase/mobilization nuclease domain-containing protein [Octadecabacter sp.]